jgi:hypothetical protein
MYLSPRPPTIVGDMQDFACHPDGVMPAFAGAPAALAFPTNRRRERPRGGATRPGRAINIVNIRRLPPPLLLDSPGGGSAG